MQLFLFMQVARHLVAAGHDVHVVTGAPDFVFTSEIQSPNLFIRKVCLCLTMSWKHLVVAKVLVVDVENLKVINAFSTCTN